MINFIKNIFNEYKEALNTIITYSGYELVIKPEINTN